MKPYIAVLFIAFALVSRLGATSWVWMSAEQYIKASDLIAIVEVTEVETVTTSHGFLLETAKARIVDRIYTRWEPDDKEIRIFNLDCHAGIQRDAGRTFITKNNPWSLRKGKFLVMLKLDGAFSPYDRFSIQSIENGNVTFPTESFSIDKPSSQELPVKEAVKRLMDAAQKIKDEQIAGANHEQR